jgi:hypothetical protein
MASANPRAVFGYTLTFKGKIWLGALLLSLCGWSVVIWIATLVFR